MDERTALIPGGARGIGGAIARRLAEKGWAVAVCYRSSEQEAGRLVAEIEARGGRALAWQSDVARPEECEQLVARALEECGRIDALVHCVGPFRSRALLEESVQGWRETFDANLHSLFYLSRLVAPHMIERGWGRILSFAIANADRAVAQTGITAYYTAKVGVLVLTRSLAKALAAHGITVNAISPGFIDSGGAPLEELERMLPRIPAGRLGDLRDAASAADFLLSEEAAYVNGANLQISGGWGI
jgi:3-oxoacyl-[acyl-carrier protein] reductase